MRNFPAAAIAPQIFKRSFLASLTRSAITLLAIWVVLVTDSNKSFASASDDEKIGEELQAGTAFNVKRYIRRTVANYFGREGDNPYWILDTVEMKTAWHPIGL